MKINDEGLQIIKEFEGCKLKAYYDAVGVLTIGYGHTGNVTEGQTITKDEAVELLKIDIEKFERHVMQFNHIYNFNENEFSALVSFAYNIGSIGELTKWGSRTKKEISEKILAYNKAGGKVLKGLTRRRKAEQELFLQPVGLVGTIHSLKEGE